MNEFYVLVPVGSNYTSGPGFMNWLFDKFSLAQEWGGWYRKRRCSTYTGHSGCEHCPILLRIEKYVPDNCSV